MNTTEETIQTFPDMILARVRMLKQAFDDSHRPRTADYVTLKKRNSGDYFGAISARNNLEWLGGIRKGLVTYPVVPRAIRSKTATSVSTDIRLEFTPAVNLPEIEAGVQIAENIWNFLETQYWTENLRTSLAQLRQYGGFAAVRADVDHQSGPTVGSRPALEQQWQPKGETLFGCRDCGGIYEPEELGLSARAASAPENENRSAATPEPETDPETAPETETADDEASASANLPAKPVPAQFDTTGASCPGCGSGDIAEESTQDFELGTGPSGEFFKVVAANFDLEDISPLLIRFDDLNTIGFKWHKAHWFNYHPIIPAYELLSRRPALRDKLNASDYSDWSHSARWYYELSKPKGSLASPSVEMKSFLDTLCEVDYTWFKPLMCGGWRSPSDFALLSNGEYLSGAQSEDKLTLLSGIKGEKIEVVFDILEGETIEEAFRRREPGKPFNGLMVETWGDDHLIDSKNDFFTSKWSLFGWQIDAASAIPMGEERLCNLQDAATNVLSMLYSLIQKATMPKGVADTRYFRQDDLLTNQPGQWAFTKQDMLPDERGSVMNHVGYLVPPNPPAIVDLFVNLIIQISKEESGVFDETVGSANQGNQTARGREVALNQSLNLMLPPVKAEKEGLVFLCKMLLKLWQSEMPPDGYKIIKGTFDEEWKPADILAFKNLDIDNELRLSAVEGTDIPRHRSEYEQRYFTAVQLGLFMEPNPVPLEIRQKILETLGLKDVDLLNYRADRRLAARRADIMKELTAEFVQANKLIGAASGIDFGYDDLIEIVPDELSGLPKRALVRDLKLTIAQDPRTKVNMEDNHLTFIGYYTDQLKGKRGASEPREVEILLLEDALDAHRAIVAATQAQMIGAENAASGAPPQMGASENSPETGGAPESSNVVM